MIIVFHYVYLIARLFTKYVMKSYHQNSGDRGINSLVDSTEQKIIVDSDVICDDMGIRFIPPVYVQRYMAVCKILEDDRWNGTLKKVIDFGCAELGFFQYVKNVPGVQEMVAVDIDEELLRYYKCRASPLTSDYLKKRHEPLTVHVLAGSIAEQDSRLQGTDAVICIELIEHLYPDTLEALPYTVFEYIHPKVAIFTTPNSEFNVLLPNFSGFRHDDHKFEWTREQFTCWAQNLTVRYPQYTVSFVGVAPGPKGTSQFGCCSQMAVFVQDGPDFVEHVQNVVDSDIEHKFVYKLMDTYEYPFEVDTRTVEEIIRDEATYYISSYGSSHMYDIENDDAHIPLGLLMPSVRKWCDSINKLREVLEDSCWRVVESCGQLCVVYSHKRWSNWFDDQDDEGNCSNVEEEAEESVVHEQEAVDPLLRATEEQDDWGSVEPHADAYQWCCEKTLDKSKESGAEQNTVVYGSENFDSLPTNGGGEGPLCVGDNLETSVLATTDSSMLQGETDYHVSHVEVSIEKDYSCVPESYNADEETSCTSSHCDIYSDLNKVELPLAENSDENCINFVFENCDVYDKGCESTVEVLACGQTINDYVHRDVGEVCAEICAPVTQTCDVIQTVMNHSNCGSGKNSSIKRSEHFDRECGSPAFADVCSQNKRLSRNLEAALEESSNVDSYSLEEQNDKAVDSGYPNSTDVDLDLTPEQVDEISTENDVLLTGNSSFDEDSEYEASLSGSEADPVHPVLHLPEEIVRDVQDEGMENGDVANNNQDEEGNNAEAGGNVAVAAAAAAIDLAVMMDLENENNLANMDPFPNWLLHLLGVANLGDDGEAAGPWSEDEDDSSSVSMHGLVQIPSTVSLPGASDDMTVH